MEQSPNGLYEAPAIVDTFDAVEVLGTAQGQIWGNGSHCTYPD